MSDGALLSRPRIDAADGAVLGGSDDEKVLVLLFWLGARGFDGAVYEVWGLLGEVTSGS